MNDLRKFLFVTLEGALYVYLGYRTVGATLLTFEGLGPASRILAWAAAGLLMLLASAVLARRLLDRPIWPSALVDGAAFLLLTVAFPFRFVSRASTKRFDTSYLPLEWHKVHYNFEMFYGLAPSFAWAVLGAVLLFCAMGITRKLRPVLAVALVAIIALIFTALLDIKMGPRVVAYFLVFSLPFLVAFLAALKGWPRVLARSTAVGALSGVLFLFYLGLLPSGKNPSAAESTFLEILYPPPGQASEFTTAFFREMMLDRDRSAIIFSYGPTCGVVRFDLGTRALLRKDFQGLVRYLAPGPGETVWGLDWINADFLKVDAKTLAIEATDIFGGGLYTPIEFFEDGDRFEVISSARPGIVELKKDTLERTRSVFFDEMGMTRFHSGAWQGDFDPATRRLYFVLGMTDLRDRFSIVEFDTASFTVRRNLEVAAGGIMLKVVKEENAILLPSFWTREISVIDLDSYRVTRVLPGPLTCRNLVYDSRRKLVYALGFSSGTLEVIGFRDGRRLATVAVGNKGLGLLFDSQEDQLYIGSLAGIVRIRVGEMLRHYGLE